MAAATATPGVMIGLWGHGSAAATPGRAMILGMTIGSVGMVPATAASTRRAAPAATLRLLADEDDLKADLLQGELVPRSA